jgi:hypothetical protein
MRSSKDRERALKVFVEQSPDLSTALSLLKGRATDFVVIHGNCTAMESAAHSVAGPAQLHGATSCRGAMTHAGHTEGVGVFAISDPDGAYGTALEPMSADPRAAARTATLRALAAADRMGERPELVWLSATPGAEEDVLAGIEDAIGSDVPIIGGSAADNSISAEWYVFDRQNRSGDGVVVSVLFPSAPVSFAYQNGYSPTGHSGTVTQSSGRRVFEIDGRSALDRYRAWTNGAIPQPDISEPETAILAESTLWPLGREVGQLGSVPFYLLAHPAVARADGSIDLFATVATGEKLTLMTGTKDGLIARAGRVASLARSSGQLAASPISGALMVYCGGCMLSVQDRLDEVVAGVNDALDGAPFLGTFTFGEQGALIRAGNRHGNLMISCIVFG